MSLVWPERRAIIPPMRASALAALVLLASAPLAACGYTSDARRAEIAREITQENQDRLTRAVAAKLRERGATSLVARRESLLMDDVKRCVSALRHPTPEPPAELELELLESAKLVAPCSTFADNFGPRAVEAKTKEGKGVVVIRAERDVELATTAAGKLLVLRPRINIVEGRVVRTKGTCDRSLYDAPRFMPIESVFVLEGRRLDQIEYVDFEYDGVREDVRCDGYIE